MDVKFINPFVHGTVEAMKKMGSLDIQPGKVYLTESNVAAGDVSGIIGLTGDATGSLAISFNETCICRIVSGLTGGVHAAADRKVFDVVREITKMILAVAGTYIEKEGLKVYAALPTVVCGKSHMIEPHPGNPSITIPFSTERDAFIVDLCIKPRAVKASRVGVERAAKVVNPCSAIPTAVAKAKLVDEQVITEEDRKALLKMQLAETTGTRDELLKQLSEQPFMEMSQRQKIKKTLPVLEAKIKRLKLDLAALEMMAKISSAELENPTIISHYQHYSNKKKH